MNKVLPKVIYCLVKVNIPTIAYEYAVYSLKGISLHLFFMSIMYKIL